MDALWKQIEEQLAEYSGVFAVTAETPLTALGLDSFSYISMICAIEEATGITIPDEELLKFQRAGDILRYLQNPWNEIEEFETLRALLQNQAQLFPTRPALQALNDDGRLQTLSYCQLWQQIQVLGTALYHRGIRKQRVLVAAQSSLPSVVLLLTLFCSDNVVLSIDAPITDAKWGKLLATADASVIFCDAKQLSAMPLLDTDCQTLSIEQLEAWMQEGAELLGQGQRSFSLQYIQMQQTALVRYTQSIGGDWLGILHSHAAIASNARHFSMTHALDGSCMNTLPLHHGCGLLVGIFGVLASGGAIAVCSEPESNLARYCTAYQPDQILLGKTALKTICQQILTMPRSAVRQLLGTNCHTLLCEGSGGAPASVSSLKEKGLELLPYYGIAEVGMVVSMARRGEPQNGSAGKAIAGILVKIDAAPTADGTPPIGEILVSTHWAMQGYEGHPERTRAVLHDGWLHTGSIGYLDEEDRLFVLAQSDVSADSEAFSEECTVLC